MLQGSRQKRLHQTQGLLSVCAASTSPAGGLTSDPGCCKVPNQGWGLGSKGLAVKQAPQVMT